MILKHPRYHAWVYRGHALFSSFWQCAVCQAWVIRAAALGTRIPPAEGRG